MQYILDQKEMESFQSSAEAVIELEFIKEAVEKWVEENGCDRYAKGPEPNYPGYCDNCLIGRMSIGLPYKNQLKCLAGMKTMEYSK